MSGLGFTYILNGRSDLAVSLLRTDYELAPDATHQIEWARMALTFGLAYLREGEPADAVEPIERACAIAFKGDDRQLQLDARLILCALRLAQERDADAAAEFPSALHAVSVEEVAPTVLQTARIVAEVFPLAEGLKDERASALLRALRRWSGHTRLRNKVGLPHSQRCVSIPSAARVSSRAISNLEAGGCQPRAR